MARQNFGSTIGPVNYTASNNLTNNPFYNYNKNTIIGGSKSFDKNKKKFVKQQNDQYSSGGQTNNKKDWSKYIGIAQSAGSAIDAFTQAKTDPSDSQAQLQNQVRGGISDAAIQSGNPIAMAIGVGSKLVDAIGAQTGLNLDNIDKEAGKDAGISGAARGFNNLMNYIPGNSMIWGAFASKTQNADVISDEVKDIQGAYGDSYGDLESAQKLSGKRFLFGRRKANKFINEANETNQKMQDIATTNTLRKQSDYGNDIMQQNLNRYAGTNYMYNAVGKQGMKLMSIEQAKLILMMRKNVEQKELQIFANGGAINIIPEGARHSRLNHLDEVHDDFEDVTKKGIPVVTVTENGDLEQVAEIERKELILRLEVTQKLEKLMKDGSDEAAIEAGKLLVKEIIKNTDDKTEELL